jgi:glutamyl-tRNA reductase
MAKSTVSVASLATRQLEAHGQRIAIVGAGETGRLAIESLIKRGFTKLTIVNRTFQRADALAQHFNIQALSLADFLSISETSDKPDWDSVLFAIDSEQPVFFCATCQRPARRHRYQHAMYSRRIGSRP